MNLPDVEQDHTRMSSATTPKPKRYCSDRLSKTQFIVIVCTISLAVFIALVFAIGFLVILPRMIPDIVFGLFFDSDWTHIEPQRLAVVEATDDSIVMHLTMYAKDWKLPISFGTGIRLLYNAS
jgi:hypothetical protein